MFELTSKDRFKRMFEHRDADRIPIIDTAWEATRERRQREGMPADVDYVDVFGLERIAKISGDNSPRYPEVVIEDTEDYVILTSDWGVALKNWKHAASTPEFIDFKIVDRDAWRQAKQRMTPADDRIDWDYLSRNYPKWRKDGYWIQAYTPFGFDMAHSWIVGTERTLMAISEDPEWCSELFNAQLDLCLALMDKVWDAGYKSMTPCPIDLPKSDQ